MWIYHYGGVELSAFVRMRMRKKYCTHWIIKGCLHGHAFVCLCVCVRPPYTYPMHACARMRKIGEFRGAIRCDYFQGIGRQHLIVQRFVRLPLTRIIHITWRGIKCGVLLRGRGTMFEYGLSPKTEDGQVGTGVKRTPSSFIVSENFHSSTHSQALDLSSLSLAFSPPTCL